MIKITLQLPDDFENEHDETVRFLAAKLYESGKLTLGQAADICGMKKWDYAELLVNYGVHFFDASAKAALGDAYGV